MDGKKVKVIRSCFLFIAIFIVGSVVLTGCSGGSFVTTPAPTGVTAAGGDGQATIAWTAVPSATSYNIYWSSTTGVTTANGTKVAGAANPYTLTGLTNGTKYYFVVTAVSSSSSGSGESAPSSQVSCTADPLPTGVTATAGDGQATIAWTPMSGATSFNIYWATKTGVTPATGTKITGAANPYTLNAQSNNGTKLTNGTTYYFVVTAISSDGESAASTEVNAVPTATPPPAAPTGVTSVAGDLQATISWTLMPNTNSYNIYWSTTTGVTPANGTKIASATDPYILTGLTNETTYYFVVTAVNGNGESAPSSEASCKPMQPVPQGVTATPGSGQITIAWSPVTGALSYNIYWSTFSGVTPLNGITKPGGVTTTSFTLTGLTTGTTYYFVVTDVIPNSDGKTTRESTASAEVSAIAQ